MQDLCDTARLLAGTLDSKATEARTEHVRAELAAFVKTMSMTDDINAAKLSAREAAFAKFPVDPEAGQLVELADKLDAVRAREAKLDAALSINVGPGERHPSNQSPARKLIPSPLPHLLKQASRRRSSRRQRRRFLLSLTRRRQS